MKSTSTRSAMAGRLQPGASAIVARKQRHADRGLIARSGGKAA